MKTKLISKEKDYFGFYEETEYLPLGFDTFNSKEKLRILFLNLSNNLSKASFIFNKYEQILLSKYPLKEAFRYKINKFMPYGLLKHPKHKYYVFNLCKNSTIIINNYINKKSEPYKPSSVTLTLAKIISYTYSNTSMSVLHDKQLLFHKFVLSKVRNLHKTKTIKDLGNAINVEDKKNYNLKIYTSWKHIEDSKLDIDKELNCAIKSIKNDEFHQIYLAYPKHQTFKKLISIKIEELKDIKYTITVIPFSLRSILRKLNISSKDKI